MQLQHGSLTKEQIIAQIQATNVNKPIAEKFKLAAIEASKQKS